MTIVFEEMSDEIVNVNKLYMGDCYWFEIRNKILSEFEHSLFAELSLILEVGQWLWRAGITPLAYLVIEIF
jgi:hypothetical protein